jgi:hypothetical protein
MTRTTRQHGERYGEVDTISATTIGTLISGLAALLFIILALVTFRARRADRKAGNLAAVRETNVAALEWAYKVRSLAAIHGANWLPALPKEMTPEYLTGKAEGESNPELAQLADFAAKMLPQGQGSSE